MLLHDCILVKRFCTCSVYESGCVQNFTVVDVETVDVEILSCCPLGMLSCPTVMCFSVPGLFVAALVKQTLILI